MRDVLNATGNVGILHYHKRIGALVALIVPGRSWRWRRRASARFSSAPRGEWRHGRGGCEEGARPGRSSETEARGLRGGAGEARWAWARRGWSGGQSWGRARWGGHGGRGAGRGRINGERDETEQGRGGAPAPTQRAPAALTTATVTALSPLNPSSALFHSCRLAFKRWPSSKTR